MGGPTTPWLREANFDRPGASFSERAGAISLAIDATEVSAVELRASMVPLTYRDPLGLFATTVDPYDFLHVPDGPVTLWLREGKFNSVGESPGDRAISGLPGGGCPPSLPSRTLTR